MPKRLDYIDTAKGLLMIIVIMSHIPAVAHLCGIEQGGVNMEVITSFISPFFMPAFFLITGFCSNFNKDFYPFIRNNFKDLIIVGLILFVIDVLLSVILTMDIKSFSTILSLPKILIGRGCYYWFLSALFVAKIIFYIINKRIYDVKLKLLISFLLPLALFFLDQEQKIYNFWYFEQAVYLLPFIAIGNCCKNKEYFLNNKYIIISIFVYLLVIVILKEYVDLPSVTMIIHFPDKLSLLLYFIISILGSIALLSIAKIINRNRILQYAGRSSIIIYTMHIELLLFFEDQFRYLVMNFPWFWWYLIVLTLTFISTLVIAYILNSNNFKFILLK